MKNLNEQQQFFTFPQLTNFLALIRKIESMRLWKLCATTHKNLAFYAEIEK